MGKENQMIKNCKKKFINVDSRSNRLDTKSFAVLAANKVNSFLQAIQPRTKIHLHTSARSSKVISRLFIFCCLYYIKKVYFYHTEKTW